MKRLYYLVAISFLIVLGLLSRRIPFLPDETGDAMWAITLFCFLRALLTEWTLARIAFASFLVSYFVEFSQLIRWDWLLDVRSTVVGHLLLGQGFLVSDLVAYTIGIVIVWYFAHRVENARGSHEEVRQNPLAYDHEQGVRCRR